MTTYKKTSILISLILFFTLAACGGIKPRARHSSQSDDVHSTRQKNETDDPRMLASLNLTSQAEKLLNEGKYDEAINMLERSVAIHSQNGKNYFFLAEAWLMKGNINLAKEFNQLASIYLKTDSHFSKRIKDQKTKIDSYFTIQ
ncbi:MAG: hypothetical protein KJ737_24145 [Proteobacteria bacterium]|nr:hypothetical protein [Pseudomonadota bacterium]